MEFNKRFTGLVIGGKQVRNCSCGRVPSFQHDLDGYTLYCKCGKSLTMQSPGGVRAKWNKKLEEESKAANQEKRRIKFYEDMKNNQVSDEAKCFNQNPSNEKRRLNRFT